MVSPLAELKAYGEDMNKFIDYQSGKHCFKNMNKMLWEPRGLSN